MSKKDYKVIIYKRGDKFSCRAVYNRKAESITCHDIEFPAEASPKIIEKFLEEAQTAMYKKIEAEYDQATGV